MAGQNPVRTALPDRPGRFASAADFAGRSPGPAYSGRVLVGRGDQISRFRGAADKALSGRVTVLVVEGEAGVGKSALLEHAVSLSSEGRYPIYAPRALASLGAALVMRDRVDAALPLLAQAATEAQAIRLVYGHTATLIHIGEAHLAAGQFAEALRYVEEALDLATRQGARGDKARTLHLRGEIRTRAEPAENQRAIEDYALALGVAEELGMAPLQARCRLGLGAVYQRIGHLDEARDQLAYAAAMLQAMQMQYWLDRYDVPITSASPPRDDRTSG